MKKLALIMTGMLLMTGCFNGASENSDEEYPSGLIEFVAPASPGGGWDLTARSMQRTLNDNDLVQEDINVINKPAGGGEVGWKYLQSNDSHTLALNSSLLFTNNMLGLSEMSYEDFTPLAILATEWQAIAVGNNSEFDDAEGVMKQLKDDPTSLKIGVAPGLGNDDHLSFIRAAQSYGVDVSQLDFLVYESGGEVVTALLGDHIDAAAMSVSEASEQYKAGRLKMVAVSSDERLEELPEVPTFEEEGIDIVFPHWRGIMGPPDMTEEEIAYWDERFQTMIESEDWAQILENNQWDDYYMDSEETAEFMKEQEKVYNDLLTNSGLVE
ncbi:tripartite tricarboxylate transporter substrate binding protein [Alteribacillus sp. HJP-4]|uniref:tripartite tricarboxylate transporter substrate binding protein n=1 Tax=Alteribacillus sp. HJP-4 TaxID=2775394 RepID=UPI0035CD08EA